VTEQSAPGTPVAPKARRSTKSMVLLASAAIAVLTLVSWTQVWFGVTLVDGAALEVDGQVAAPALSALALTSLVLVGALAIAGPFFRVVFGVLESLIGVAVLFSGVLAVSDPIAASASAISTATGVAGKTSVAQSVASLDGGVWPWIALGCGALMLVAGVAIIVLSRRWPNQASRKYQATRLEPASTERSAVDDWDALSGGNDPTTRD